MAGWMRWGLGALGALAFAAAQAAAEEPAAGAVCTTCARPGPVFLYEHGEPEPFDARRAILRIETNETGIHRLTGGEIAAAGIALDQLDPARLNLYHRGRAVPVRVRVSGAAGEVFAPETTLEFYGTHLEGGFSPKARYSDERAYFLVAHDEAPPARWRQAANTLEGREPSPTADRRLFTTFVSEGASFVPHFEHDYSDPFDFLVSSILKSTENGVDVMYYLHDYDPAGGEAAFLARFYGRSELPANPDHHLIARINGTTIGDVTFDGRTACYITHEQLGPEVFGNGTVNVRLFLPGDLNRREGQTEPAFDVVMLDWIKFEYPTTLGGFHGYREAYVRASDVPEEIRRLNATDLPTSPVLVYDRGSNIEYAADIAAHPSGRYRAGFTALLNNDTRLVITTADNIRRVAGLRRVQPAPLLETARGAELLIVTHDSLAEEATRLRDHKRATGLSTEVALVDDIYDQFGHGHKSPEAIRDFLRAAAGEPGAPLRHVLLAGSARMDPKQHDHNYVGNIDLVPTPYYPSNRYPPYPWDNWYGNEGDHDPVPRLAVGRIPARDSAEMAVIVDKIIEYETAAALDWATQVLLAGSVEPEIIQSLEKVADKIGQSWPAAQTTRVYTDPKTEDEVYVSQMLEAIDGGVGLLLFTGHGSRERWAQGPIGRVPKRFLFDLQAIEEAANAGRYPVVVAGTCYTNVFDMNDEREALGRALLFRPRGGGIAVLSANYRVSMWEGIALPPNFVEALLEQPAPARLGDVLLATLGRIGNPEARAALTLLGDPSLRLPFPAAAAQATLSPAGSND